MPDTLTTQPPAAGPATGDAPRRTGVRRNVGYWIAALVAAVALAAAIAFGVLGTLRTLDRPDGFSRAAIPGGGRHGSLSTFGTPRK